jgi:nicotinate phosphoribosyltransferase
MIIKSLLDTDFYKITMAKAVFDSFSEFNVEYEFKCRNENIIWTNKMLSEIKEEFFNFCNLTFQQNEIDYLKKLTYFDDNYLNFLKNYKPNYNNCKIYLNKNKELKIKISGLWLETIFFEIPILAIVNEVYFRNTTDFEQIKQNGYKLLTQKIKIANTNEFKFSDFGTRRRYSYDWHSLIISELKILSKSIFTGTSNVFFAMNHDLAPIGTMAHEFIQASQGIINIDLKESQSFMLEKWLKIFNGKLSIALTDTLGFDKFLKDFNLKFTYTYDGVRHDSGDPIEWAKKMLIHYEKFNIDTRFKTLVFSDGLNFNKAAHINNMFKDKTNCLFGIGTNLTNDFENITPLQIVIKMTKCNNQPVAKLSDNPSKTMCKNKKFLNTLKKAIME